MYLWRQEKFSNFSDVPLFDSRTKEKNACPGNALLGIENSYEWSVRLYDMHPKYIEMK